MSEARAEHPPKPRGPLAQGPHLEGFPGLQELKQQGFGALRLHFGGTLDVEGRGP